MEINIETIEYCSATTFGRLSYFYDCEIFSFRGFINGEPGTDAFVFYFLSDVNTRNPSFSRFFGMTVNAVSTRTSILSSSNSSFIISESNTLSRGRERRTDP